MSASGFIGSGSSGPIPISGVTGLQTALDAKLPSAGLEAVIAPYTEDNPGLLLPGTISAPVARMGTALQSGHGYATNAGGSANLNDTSTFALGSQSATLTTNGSGTAKTLKPGSAFTAIDATGLQPVIWLRTVDQTKLAALQLYLGDTALSNFYRWELKSSAGQKWIQDGEWTKITLSWSEAAITGTPSRTAITMAQFRIVDDATGPITVGFNGWGLVPESTTWTNGVVSFTFDDTYASHYTEARRILDAYGYGATAYVIQEYVGNAGRMTMQNLKDMERYNGWEVCAHSLTAADHASRFTSFTYDQLVTKFASMKSWIADNGFSGDHVAFPGGEFNADVLLATERYFTAGVTVFQRPETLPPARRSKMRRGGYVTSSTLVSTITAAIDAAYTNKNHLIIGMHDIVSAVSSTSDYLATDLATIVAYCATKGIPVRTVGEVLRTRPTSVGGSADAVKLTGDQSVDGIKTFAKSPVVPTPTTGLQTSTKQYTDDQAQAAYNSAQSYVANNAVFLTGDQSVDGIKSFIKSPVVPTPTTASQAATKAYADSLVTGLSKTTDVQAFTANGTWTKPAGAKSVNVILVGGGGGGGSGRRGNATTVRGGGGGGAGGHFTDMTFIADDLTATVTVTVGLGASGAAAPTTDDTNGNIGSTGGTTQFGLFTRAAGGNGAGAGTTSGGVGGGSSNAGTVFGGAGGAGGAGAGGSNATNSGGPGGGGGGGGVNASNGPFAGGMGGPSLTGVQTTGGVVGGVNPNNGAAAKMMAAGAGGGAASGSADAQSGAVGGFPGGGGGGGGASANTFAAGAGGAGGNGYAIITTYF